jgi:glycosyltransferase involved in cell wall biosynthesis
MNLPIVSIVLPTRDREKLLRSCIESIYRQTFKEWELLVIDNESKDGTEALMEELSKKDYRIRYLKVLRSKIPGISEYLNFGIKSSKGKYIARIDDDDVWCYDDKLKEQVDFLDSNPDYVLVGGGVIMVNSDNKILYKYFKKEKDGDIRKRALLSCPFGHSTIMFRKDAAEKAGGYCNYSFAEDWGLYLKLGKTGKFYNFQKYYLNYLVADQNNSFSGEGDRQTQIAKFSLEVIKKHRKDYPNFYLGYLVNSTQYIYSFFPDFIKKRMQYFLRYIKRKYF